MWSFWANPREYPDGEYLSRPLTKAYCLDEVCRKGLTKLSGICFVCLDFGICFGSSSFSLLEKLSLMPLMIFYLCARTLIYVYMFCGYCCCLLKYSWSPWPCPVSEGLACHYKLLLGLAAERGSTVAVALYEHYLQKPGLLSTLCQEMESHTRRM